MGMTPAGGLIMSTRTGDLDPGIVSFVQKHEKLSADDFHRLVNHESGMLGVSGTSGDVRDLLAAEKRGDDRAAEALEMFCYSARKWVAAMAAAMGGLETLVFSAGIGEHSPEIRWRICEKLDFLGIRLNRESNQAGANVISAKGERVTVRIIPTDEEQMIARIVTGMLDETADTPK
jgi:acetate kinase